MWAESSFGREIYVSLFHEKRERKFERKKYLK